MDENARNAARWLAEALRGAGYHVGPIDWTTHGLKARVSVDGCNAGQLGAMWEELRDGTLIERLQARKQERE